ncbi:site-specific integrase [Novosphingobium sp.]|uniref:tyrosine-type recombinase/integrase n=1 Tax=Novosphingobium sp. TaxID=1874826 RepID=UPI0025E9D442|nr:site-specific integrase [Novosphingobium sp.]
MATKLTDSKIRALKAPEVGQIEHADADVPGLRVRIGVSGAKTFILRRRWAGKVRNITVGRYGPRFGLADARRKARALLSDLESDKPPPAPKGRSVGAAETIRGMLPAYLAAKAHLRSIADTKRILEQNVLPELGDRLADTVTRGDVTKLIDAIAQRSPSRARATLAQLSAFYTWALPGLDRMLANPCRDARRPDKLPARGRVLTADELVGLWKVAEAEPLPWGAALKLLILTGQRRNEVFWAEWSEFDLEDGEWTVPPDRAKNAVANVVPLSPAALAVVQAIPKTAGSEKLFPSRRDGERGASGFSKAQARFRKALDRVLGRKAGEHWQMHDIRRTVATGLQRLGVRFEVTEAVLNHVSGARSGVAGVYQRHDWKVEKREALERWADFVAAELAKGAQHD